jgi:hypothetical protein
MAEDDRVEELEMEVARLMREVDRYRTAAEDALQQLDWCIGYFAGAHKGQIARELGANRVQIRRDFMRRGSQNVPASPGGGKPS